jgi:hypothetical protein
MTVSYTTSSIRQSLRNIARARPTFWIVLTAIVVYAAALRLYGLDRYPMAVDQDEMVLGYDAWSLWHTGRDHHGQWFPIHFQNFGDYVPPTADYVAAPFVGLLGLSEFTTRLPTAVMGIATVILVALLGRRWFGPAAGLLAALFLTISAWHINYSRFAFPTGVLPFFTVCGLYTFTRAADGLEALERGPGRRRWPVATWFAISGGCLALLTGGYSTMKVEGPLLFGACLLAAAPLLWRHRRMALLWIGVYLIIVSPLFIDVITRWPLISLRFHGVSSYGYPDWPLHAIRLYADHFNPAALSFEAFGGSVGVYPPFVGNLFWLDIPLCLAAVIGLARHPRSRVAAFSLPVLLALWLFTYPIADSLTVGDERKLSPIGRPHELRAYNLLPLPELAAGYGAVVVWRWLVRYRWGWLPAAGFAVGTASLVGFFNVLFLPRFFDPAVNLGGTPYNFGLGPALDVVTRSAGPCDSLWVDNDNQPYIYYLFMTQYPSERFQKLATTTPIDFSNFDQYHARLPEAIPEPVFKPECQGQPYRAFVVTRSDFMPSGWEQLYPGADGDEIARLARWRVLVSADRFPWPGPPAGVTPLRAILDGKIGLEGYRLQRDGKSLTITLYWRPYDPLTDDYIVFVHAMKGSALIAQRDGPPTPAAHTWKLSELVATTVTLELPADSAEPDTIYVGMYTFPSVERLPVVQDNTPRGDGQVLLWKR